MPASKKRLDFTNVKEGSQFKSKHMPEGDYAAVIVSVDDVTSSNDNDMWVYAIKLKDYPRAVYPFRCILTENSLWRVRNLFQAAGVTITRKMVALDPNRIVGKEIGVELQDDEYQGNVRSEITAVMPIEDMTINNNAPDLDDEEDEEEEAPPAKKAPARRRKPAPVEEDDEEEELEDDEEEEEEPAPPKRRTAPAKKAEPARRRKAPEPEPEEDEEEDDEEDEPEPPRKTRQASSRTRAAATRKPAAKRRPAPVQDDEDDDEMEIDDL